MIENEQKVPTAINTRAKHKQSSTAVGSLQGRKKKIVGTKKKEKGKKMERSGETGTQGEGKRHPGRTRTE